ncbi:MAG: hypothetical protein ACK5N8_07080 [Alphaproteobacteria bacterium]
MKNLIFKLLCLVTVALIFSSCKTSKSVQPYNEDEIVSKIMVELIPKNAVNLNFTVINNEAKYGILYKVETTPLVTKFWHPTANTDYYFVQFEYSYKDYDKKHRRATAIGIFDKWDHEKFIRNNYKKGDRFKALFDLLNIKENRINWMLKEGTPTITF